MRLIFAAALAALAMGCQRIDSKEADHLAPGCDARATQNWSAGGATYSVEAMAAGPDCQRAVATIVIRDGSGVPLYAEAHMAHDIMVLAPARDEAGMRTALQEWVTYDSHTMATTGALPEWPAHADGPQNGEFPFYPSESMVRDEYVALRQRNAPLFCYVQGMESMACLALEDGQFTKIGVQTFPG